jgi:hypothetical protein
MSLTITTAAPTVTVYVSLDSNGNAQFNLDNGPTWYPGPISWAPPALTVTFSLGTGIKEIQYKGGDMTVSNNVATIHAVSGTDSFTVVKDIGSEDPKIVVTPQ